MPIGYADGRHDILFPRSSSCAAFGMRGPAGIAPGPPRRAGTAPCGAAAYGLRLMHHAARIAAARRRAAPQGNTAVGCRRCARRPRNVNCFRVCAKSVHSTFHIRQCLLFRSEYNHPERRRRWKADTLLPFARNSECTAHKCEWGKKIRRGTKKHVQSPNLSKKFEPVLLDELCHTDCFLSENRHNTFREGNGSSTKTSSHGKYNLRSPQVLQSAF